MGFRESPFDFFIIAHASGGCCKFNFLRSLRARGKGDRKVWVGDGQGRDGCVRKVSWSLLQSRTVLCPTGSLAWERSG